MSLDALRGFDMFWLLGGQQIVAALAQDASGSFTEEYITESLITKSCEANDSVPMILLPSLLCVLASSRFGRILSE